MAGKGGEVAPGAMPGGMPSGDPTGMGIDPQMMRQMMAMQFLSSAANNVGNIGAFQKPGQQPQRVQQQSSPLANLMPMLQMQQMGLAGQDRERKLAEDKQQKQAFYGQYAPEAGGKPWVNPDTGKTEMGGGLLSQVDPSMQPILRALGPDKGSAAVATIMAQNMKPKEPTASIQEFEYAKKNGYGGTFEDFKKVGGTSSVPATIQEWQMYNSLPAADQERFLAMKRANNWLNMGGTQMLPSQVNPAGSPRAEVAKTIPPEQTPQARADVKLAEGGAEATVKQQDLARKNKTAFDTFEVGLKNLETAMSNTTTNPVAGSLPALTASAQIAEGSGAQLAPVLKNMFREAGEGTFTDKDQELLLDMVPKRTDHPEARKAKTQMIRQIVSAKLGLSGATAAPGGGADPLGLR